MPPYNLKIYQKNSTIKIFLADNEEDMEKYRLIVDC